MQLVFQASISAQSSMRSVFQNDSSGNKSTNFEKLATRFEILIGR